VEIFLPPIAEQRRIAAILDQADALRAKRREALAELDGLAQAIFVEMFGELRFNPNNWQTFCIETVCEFIVDCVNRTAPVVDHETPYRMIRTTNVKSGKVDLRSVRYVTEETFNIWNRRATPKNGDVLLTREAPVGEAGILEGNENVFLGQRLMLYRPMLGKMTSEYLLYSFLSPFLQDQLERHGSGSTVKHLPLPACRSFDLRVPPYELQRDFSARIQALESLKATHRTALTELDALFASLQHRAFRGEL
jgi:type I restriction enzyme S subunit